MFYWTIPFLQMSGYGINDPSIVRTFISVLLYVIGVVIMLCADCQKYFALMYKPKGM